jgi:hypothetical protein
MRSGSKSDGAVLIAATLVGSIRPRDEEIKPSPRLNAAVQNSLLLARTILDRILGKGRFSASSGRGTESRNTFCRSFACLALPDGRWYDWFRFGLKLRNKSIDRGKYFVGNLSHCG